MEVGYQGILDVDQILNQEWPPCSDRWLSFRRRLSFCQLLTQETWPVEVLILPYHLSHPNSLLVVRPSCPRVCYRGTYRRPLLWYWYLESFWALLFHHVQDYIFFPRFWTLSCYPTIASHKERMVWTIQVSPDLSPLSGHQSMYKVWFLLFSSCLARNFTVS